MDENNIIKKKNKKNKNYYRRHNNQNKYYSMNKKKKNLILENTGEIENILLFNKEPKVKVQEIFQENIPDYEDVDIIPIRKTKKKNIFFSSKKLKYGMSFVILLIAIFGVSYSYFNYSKIDSRQADIASGDVYVKLVENETTITLPKMYPRTDEEARGRVDNYFDFTIKGKNTSKTKSVLYTIDIKNGANVSGKTRIDPQYIKLDLQEKVNNEYVYIQQGVSLNDYSYTGVVLTNTTSEITKEYRLRLWIGDNVIISDTDQNATHTQSEFNNLYATYNVEVNSEDKAIAYSLFVENADTETVINFALNSSNTNGNGLYRLYGTQNNTYPIYYYRGAVTNNNVIFGGFCWKIVRTTETGGIKMIYTGVATGDGTTCENTSSNLSSEKKFNSSIKSMSDVGYMYNTRYEYVRGNAASNSIFGKSVEWNGTKYLVIEDNAGVASTNTTIDNYHHYTCGTANTTACKNVRYYYAIHYSNYYYITLSNGDTVEDALYKMTGNGSSETKAKNAGYVLNQTDSVAKTSIEEWFKTNLTNEEDSSKFDFSVYLEDTSFCNDRSFMQNGDYTFEKSGWNPNGGSLSTTLDFISDSTIFNSWYSTTNVPKMNCLNETDSFSVSNEIAKLKYPVGLLTAEEMILAGTSGNTMNSSSINWYLGSTPSWSMTPSYFDSSQGCYSWGINTLGFFRYDKTVSGDIPRIEGLRPVISIKFGTEFETGGDGTPTNPYVVKYN